MLTSCLLPLRNIRPLPGHALLRPSTHLLLGPPPTRLGGHPGWLSPRPAPATPRSPSSGPGCHSTSQTHCRACQPRPPPRSAACPGTPPQGWPAKRPAGQAALSKAASPRQPAAPTVQEQGEHDAENCYFCACSVACLLAPLTLSSGGFANVPPHCSGPTSIEAQRTVTQPAGTVGLPKGRRGRYLKTWADLTLALPSRTAISCPGETEAQRGSAKGPSTQLRSQTWGGTHTLRPVAGPVP